MTKSCGTFLSIIRRSSNNKFQDKRKKLIGLQTYLNINTKQSKQSI